MSKIIQVDNERWLSHMVKCDNDDIYYIDTVVMSGHLLMLDSKVGFETMVFKCKKRGKKGVVIDFSNDLFCERLKNFIDAIDLHYSLCEKLEEYLEYD